MESALRRPEFAPAPDAPTCRAAPSTASACRQSAVPRSCADSETSRREVHAVRPHRRGASPLIGRSPSVALDLDLPRSNDASLCECLNSKLGGFAVAFQRHRRVERRLQNRSWITLRVEKLLTGRTAIDDEVTLLINAKNHGVALLSRQHSKRVEPKHRGDIRTKPSTVWPRQTCCARR